MAEQVITLTKIYALPKQANAEDDASRLWLPVTEPIEGKTKRRTVRMPFPVGDYEVECEYCDGTGKIDCPTCGGTGLGPVCDRCGGTGIEPSDVTEAAVDPCDPHNPNPNGVCTKCHADNNFKDYEGKYHVKCPDCCGTKVVDCPHCHGLGGGVMTVSPNGVIQLRYDDQVFAVNTEGLTIKVDGETIKIGENGLEVNADAIVPPSGYLKANSAKLRVDGGVVKPIATIPEIAGKNFKMNQHGLITPSISTIGGFVAKLTINISNPNYIDGTDLIKYEVTGGGSAWTFVMDTTKPGDAFTASVVVTENLTDGMTFGVVEEVTNHIPGGYTVGYSVDVHSF